MDDDDERLPALAYLALGTFCAIFFPLPRPSPNFLTLVDGGVAPVSSFSKASYNSLAVGLNTEKIIN